MSTDLVKLHLGRVFANFEKELRRIQVEALRDSGKILRREQEISMRARWFRTGASVAALGKGEVITKGDTSTYRLTTGKFYDIFGEYGTGQRGARTGQPAPQGYRYGSHEKGSMTARRFSRLAIDAARPQIIDLHVHGLGKLAKDLGA